MDIKQRRALQTFDDEIQSLLDTKPPVSKTKMVAITRAAMKGVKYYKHVVLIVEKFIAKCKPEYKVPGLYVIDSIVRQSRHQFGIERDVYAARFSRNLQITFNNLFSGCLTDDKPKIVRVLNLWQKNGVFNTQVIHPLLDMANPNSSLTLPTESTLSADSPGNSSFDQSSKQGQTSKYSSHQFNNSNNNSQYSMNSSSSGKHARTSASGLVFDKNLLDFDYDEDDDDLVNDRPSGDDGDETPTEAEPPLSSTLNKIEMEQRSRNEASNLGHQSSQFLNRQPQHQNDLSNQMAARNDSDPVLERWNKLLRQQSFTSEVSNEPPLNENRQKRQRSRSPPPKDKYVPVKEPIPVEVHKSPIERSPDRDRKAERKAERLRKCLPPIRDKHLTVCSSTLWLGHVPKTVSEADISDAFGDYGSIASIDLIPPRGCAYICMDRRQDAKKALTESRDLKLNGSHIKMAWAPGKGFKEYRKLKDFWEVDIGSSYIPYNKIDNSIDFDVLEEGGVIDEDSMSMEMREMRERKLKEKEAKSKGNIQPPINLPLPALPILSQPPPFSMLQPNQLNLPPPNHLTINPNQINMTHQAGHLTLPQSTHPNLNQHANQLGLAPNHQLSMEQAGLTMQQASMNMPPPNLGLPPMNALNHQAPGMNNLQFQQQGGISFWGWGN